MSKKILAIVLVALMVALLAPSLASAADVTLSLSKYTAGPGDTVIASGTADADTFVTIKGVSQFSDGSLGAVVLFDGVKSDAQGNYSATFRVPNDPSSNVLIIVAGYGKNVTNRSLTITGGDAGNDTTAPSWPDGSALTASKVTRTGLTLTWTTATDDTAVAGYRILKDGLQYKDVGSGTLNCSVTGLSADTSYTFKVEAGDAADNWSTSGPSVTVTTAASTGGGGGGGGTPEKGTPEKGTPEEGTPEEGTPEEGTPSPAQPDAGSFSDVPESFWASEVIYKLSGLGVINGYPDGTFRPDNKITRAEFATVLVKAFQLPAASGKVFDDTANHWASDFTGAAYAAGIVKGYSESIFGPDDLITREQMAVMIARAVKLEDEVEEVTFTDGDQISHWARGAVTAVTQAGIMRGYPDGSFAPLNEATRAEAVTVIANAL